MNRMLKIKIAAYVLIVIVISFGFIFASDVTVQQGTMTVDSDLTVSGFTYADDGLKLNDVVTLEGIVNGEYDYLYIDNDTMIGMGEVGADLGVNGNIYAKGVAVVDQYNQCYLGIDAYGFGYLYYYDSFSICNTICVQPQSCLASILDDLLVIGKIEAWYGVDPPYVLYDQQSREEIIDLIKKEVPPDKQSGAAMFFNKETKRLETYVASEGKFYDLEGNIIHELAEVVQPITKYETVYHFDSMTGQARPILRPVREKFQIKKEYSLDDKTGNFINKNTGEVASREEALEIYVASEGKIYDLQHNFVRNVEKGQSPDIAAAGNYSESSVKINTAQNNTEKQEITVKLASSNQ